MASPWMISEKCLDAFEHADYAEAVRLLPLVSKPKKLFTRNIDHERQRLGLLHLAAKNGWLDVVKDLITKYNIDLARGGSYMYTIHIAVEYNHLDIIKYLITERSYDPMVVDVAQNNKNCLHFAVENNHFDIIKYLITECNCDPMVADATGCNCLHIAVKKKHLDTVKYLILTECDPMIGDRNGWNCLHIATNNNYFDILKYLITECSCDPMVGDRNGWNCLHFAINNNYLDIITYLITECSCNPKIAGRCLHIAVAKNHLNIIKYLINEHSCDPMVADAIGCNCLHIAVDNNHLDITKYLITKFSCDPMVVDATGCNCLHIAVKKNHFDILKYLITECGCDPSVSGYNNWKNCLHIAVDKNHVDIVKYLITECGCDPMVADSKGYNCLHNAVLMNSYSVIEYLLSADLVNLLANDNNSKTYLGLARENPTMLSLFTKFGKIKTSHPVDSYVNVLLLGNPGAGKSTLAQVIIERCKGASWIGWFRNYVKGVELCTAGIIPTKLQHKELGNIILHDFAGHSEYYSSHTAVIENLLQGSGAVFVIVVDITSEDSTKHLQQWLTVVNNEVHKCNGQCCIIVAVSHVDEMADNVVIMNERKKKLSDIVNKRCNSLICLDCRKLTGNDPSSLINELSSSCSSIRNTNGKNLSLYCHMMYASLEESELNIFSLSDIINLSTSDRYILPHKSKEIFEILTSLHFTGLICLLKSHDDPNKVWVVANKQILLADLNGILFAPKSFKKFRNIASNTGIITVPSFISFFPQYDPDMLICFLKRMELCQEINPQFLTMTNLKANNNKEDKLLFFPTLLDIGRPEDMNGRVFKFGWYLQCTEDYHFFPSYYFHILVLHLAYNYGCLTQNSGKFDCHCTFWKNGIHWFDGNGVETLVEMIDDSQCILVLMSWEEGYEENMVSLLSRVVKKVMELQIESCPNLKLSKFVLDPNELEYPIDKPTQRTVYNVTDILTSIGDRKSFVISDNFQDCGKLPKQIKMKEILKSGAVTHDQLKSILEGRDLKELPLPELPPPWTQQPPNDSKVTQDWLNMGDLDDVLTFLNSHQFANHQWQDLGLHLGLYKPTLEDIDDKCRGDPRKCLRECVVAWLKREDKVMNKGGPSWALLADALHVIEEHRIANSIGKDQ